jgi:hypothetical protein
VRSSGDLVSRGGQELGGRLGLASRAMGACMLGSGTLLGQGEQVLQFSSDALCDLTQCLFELNFVLHRSNQVVQGRLQIFGATGQKQNKRGPQIPSPARCRVVNRLTSALSSDGSLFDWILDCTTVLHFTS